MAKQNQTPEPARSKLEEIAAEQRHSDVVEPSPQERRDSFGDEVRARMASPSTKNQPQAKRTLMPARMQLAASGFTVHHVIAEFGTTVEQIMDPAYWAHTAKRLTPGDEIVADAEDGSYRAKFVVLERGNMYARVALQPGWPMETQFSEPDVDVSIPNNYSVKWMGPHDKYAACRDSDKLRAGFPSKGAAAAWIQQHLRGLAA